MSEKEDQLVLQAVDGNRDSLSELLKQYGPQVRRRLSISQTWQDTLDTADVMQVTYLEAFLRIRKLSIRAPNSFVAWLTQIANNNLRDAIKELERAKRPNPRHRVRRRNPEESTIALLEQLGCNTTTASHLAGTDESIELLYTGLELLPEAYRDVIRLFDLEDKTIHEVSEIMHKSPGAIYMLRSRAHDRLREILGEESNFFSDCT